ncbi:acyltransferase [Microbacteriaceae bacterium VKM Ac-2855]|nr:acyltransferase [Microbacteriaceae bacterium VKM Ac-2855]
MVVLDHLFRWPSGGFVGVDVFFVISGFLITGLLLREYERSGTISFTEFYRRRVRRILPVALIVLVVTVAFSFALFRAGRAESAAWDALWASIFAANWNFAVVGTDYFQGGGATSPLQHFWSLSVEEQYYFVWPWLMLGALALIVKLRGRVDAARASAVLIGAVTVASLGWALFESTTNPTVAYFSTFSRAWELGVGALLATGLPLLSRIPAGLRPVLAYLGLVGIVASLFVITTDSIFPAPWAALPVLSTAAVIAAGTGARARLLWPLTNPVMTYLGDISYSIYLWHFPVIIFATALVPELEPGVAVAILAGILALSVASYHLIEKPIHTSPVLNRYPTRLSRSDAWRAWRTTVTPVYRWGAPLTMLALVAGVIVPITFAPQAVPAVATAPRSAVAAAVETAAALPPAAQALSDEISSALASTAWPELTPSVDALGSAKASEWVDDGCLGDERGADDDPIENAQRCVYGNPEGTKTVAVLGDSMAISWVPALRAILDGSDWRILVYTLQQCPASDVSVLKGDKSPHTECDSFRTATQKELIAIAPRLVITAEADRTYGRLASGAEGEAAAQEITDGMARTIRAVSPSVGHVVVLGTPPYGNGLAECATNVNTPPACVRSVTDEHRLGSSAVEAGVASASVANASYIDTDPFFCSRISNECPSFTGGIVQLADGYHLTDAYSRHLGPALGEQLTPFLG